MAPTSLLNLPSELLDGIIDVLQPGDHFNFAATCKRCYELSKNLLAHHRHCHREYQACSDLLPLTVLRLIRTLASDPIAAWHIRDLEFWGIRSVWSHWKTYRFDPSWNTQASWNNAQRDVWRGQANSVLADASGLGNTGKIYPGGEEEWTRRFEKTWNGRNYDLELQRLMQGNEEPLRILLCAMAPRIRSLRFATCEGGLK